MDTDDGQLSDESEGSESGSEYDANGGNQEQEEEDDGEPGTKAPSTGQVKDDKKPKNQTRRVAEGKLQEQRQEMDQAKAVKTMSEDWDLLATDIQDKTAREVKRYYQIFKKKWKTFPEYPHIGQRIVESEAKRNKRSDLESVLLKKIVSVKRSWSSTTRRPKTRMTADDVYERIKKDITEFAVFRFHWFFKSRSPNPLHHTLRTASQAPISLSARGGDTPPIPNPLVPNFNRSTVARAQTPSHTSAETMDSQSMTSHPSAPSTSSPSSWVPPRQEHPERPGAQWSSNNNNIDELSYSARIISNDTSTDCGTHEVASRGYDGGVPGSYILR
ncbi:hypothetical protein FIBSPDRAFT_926107 [Athelia psychrophila]|uniref:SLIDE domain-containing protein n=1 Tax=Athelia psychrophila TaxID=1759441 RepID=A0A166TUI9_9AGAM|nr:hypothetical protein FIBSPDRAFT_926107 [Fibularhizoctonia sp. CBS 109695]